MMKNETNDFIGSWGQFVAIYNQEEDSLHPDDEEKIKLFPYQMTLGLVFRCIGEEQDYLLLKYGDIVIRAKPYAYFPIPQKLGMDIEDWVFVKDEPAKKGIIYEIQWHRNREKPMFFIRVNGTRKSTKRYWEEELEKIKESPL